jgi:hypothetical protein
MCLSIDRSASKGNGARRMMAHHGSFLAALFVRRIGHGDLAGQLHPLFAGTCGPHHNALATRARYSCLNLKWVRRARMSDCRGALV